VRREESLALRHLQPGGQLLLPLGPPVLEPRLDLYFGEIERFGQFHPLADAQVLVDFEFGLEAFQLLGAVGLAGLPVESGLAGAAVGGLRRWEKSGRLESAFKTVVVK
jgi:hypothetical protein